MLINTVDLLKRFADVKYMATPIGKFRLSMNKFLDKLEEWASHEQAKELDKFKIKYEMGMKVNPRDSLTFFIECIEPFAEHILQGNDNFFLTERINVDDEYVDLLKQIKSWWPGLLDNQREYIKNNFKLLLMLGSIAIKHEGLRAVINKYRSSDNQLIY